MRTSGEMAAILRAKAQNSERFSEEECLIFQEAARMLEGSKEKQSEEIKYVDSSFAERLVRERDEARDFAEWMHELVDWQEGYIEIPWKGH